MIFCWRCTTDWQCDGGAGATVVTGVAGDIAADGTLAMAGGTTTGGTVVTTGGTVVDVDDEDEDEDEDELDTSASTSDSFKTLIDATAKTMTQLTGMN